jgi:hypothetical protein
MRNLDTTGDCVIAIITAQIKEMNSNEILFSTHWD